MFDAEHDDWEQTTVGAVLKNVVGGGTPPREVAAYWNGEIPWASVKDITSGADLPKERVTAEGVANSASRVVPQGTNILAMRMAVGRVARYDRDVAINQDLAALFPNERLDSDFLFQWLNANSEPLKAVATGTTVKGLRKEVLLQWPLLLPPLDEQKRIADVLRSVDKSIECGEAVEKQAFEVLKQTMVVSLHLEGEAGISGWEKARIGDLGKVQAGRQRAPSFTKGELRPYLRVANVFDGFIDTSDVLQMPFTAREYGEYRLVPGDILLNEGQSIELVGRAAMYLGDPEDCCFQNTLVRFRAIQVPASFAYALIRTLYWTGHLSAIASRTTSVAHLGVARFANMRVAVPPPDDQRRIGELFSDLCAAHASHQAANERLKAVRRSIMADLLSGRVRVPA